MNAKFTLSFMKQYTFMEDNNMTKYVAADKGNIDMIKAFCSAHRTRVTTIALEQTDEYIVMIECSFRTWLSLKKVLPLDKPVLVYRTES